MSSRSQAFSNLGVWLTLGLYLAVAHSVNLLLAGQGAGLLSIWTMINFATFALLWNRWLRPATGAAEPGLFFQSVVLIYTMFPLLALLAFNYQLGADADDRLSAIALDDGLIASVALSANAIIVGFGVAYLAVRRPQTLMPFRIDPSATLALWIGLAISLVVILVPSLFGSGFGTDYAGEYLFYQSLPTLIRQLLNVFSNMLLICVFGLMIALSKTGRFRQAVYLAAGCLVYFVALTEARTQLVLIAFGLVLARDHLVRRFNPRQLAGMAAGAVVLFLAIGIVRDGLADPSYVAGRSEFMAVFVTALDIQQLYVTGNFLDMNLNLFLSDVFRLVPQQLLGFEKIDPATWYVNTFYPSYAEQGGGLAFGMLAESALGGGVTAALLRGMALGAVVALCFNQLTSKGSLWRAIIYFWLFTSLYQAFRDTTFTLIGRFAFQFLPGAVLIYLLSRLLPGRRGPDPAAV